MKIVFRILDVLAWAVTIAIQGFTGIFLGIILGLTGGIAFMFILMGISWEPLWNLYGVSFVLFVGLGITLGVFWIGKLAYALRKTKLSDLNQPRLSYVFLSELIPITLWAIQHWGGEEISETMGEDIPYILVSTVLCIIGFYIPGLIEKIKPIHNPIKV